MKTITDKVHCTFILGTVNYNKGAKNIEGINYLNWN